MYILSIKDFIKKSHLEINRALLLFLDICPICFCDSVISISSISGVRGFFFLSFLIFSTWSQIWVFLSARSLIFLSISESFVQSPDTILMGDSWMILLLILESFSFWLGSLFWLGSETCVTPKKKRSSFTLISINRTILIIHLILSFRIFRKPFMLSFRIIRKKKPFFFTFLIFFSSVFWMGSKKKGFFRGEPKGSSVSIPQTVKKQKFFCFFLRSLWWDRSFFLCQGFREKGNRIFIWIPSVNQSFGNSVSDNWTPLYVHLTCISLLHSLKSSYHSGNWNNNIRPIFLTIINEGNTMYFRRIEWVTNKELLITWASIILSQVSAIAIRSSSCLLSSLLLYSSFSSSCSFSIFSFSFATSPT